MKAIVALGIIMLVLGFLSSVLSDFPLEGINASPNDPTEDDEFSIEAVEATSAKVGSMYALIIEDIASFMDDPDLNRAEQRRQEMTAFASNFAEQLDGLAGALQTKLGEIVPDYEAELAELEAQQAAQGQ